MNFANIRTQRTLTFAARATFSAWSPWCDTTCHGSATPISPNVRWLPSRDIMNVNTRVRSAWNAIASRSNISAVCSSNDSGMPSGLSMTASSVRCCVSVF